MLLHLYNVITVFPISVCTGEHEEWVNSVCQETTCAALTGGVDVQTDCEHEGCICSKGFFRNDDMKCVSFETCAICEYLGVEYMVCPINYLLYSWNDLLW